MAAQLANDGLADDVPRIRGLRDRLWSRLEATVHGIAVNGPAVDATDQGDAFVRLANNLNVRIPGVDGQSLLAALSAAGLAASSGSACSAESPRPSHVLLGLGLTDDEARASVRFGLSRFTTTAEIDVAADRVAAGVAELRGLCLRGGAG